MTATFSDFLKSISDTKLPLLEDGPDFDANDKAYPQFLVNRGLSYSLDGLLHVLKLNEYPFVLTNKMHFEYCRLGLKKGKRFAKWGKPTVAPEDIQVIKKALNYTTQKAEQIAKNLTPEQIEAMRAEQDEGGPTKVSSK